MKTLTFKEWEKEAQELFGPDVKKWQFKCSSCGHIQSIESMLLNNPNTNKEYIYDSVFMSCEGRINGKGKSAIYGKPNKKNGCDWTLGGLFRNHKTEVIQDGRNIPVFEFYKGGDKE